MNHVDAGNGLLQIRRQSGYWLADVLVYGLSEIACEKYCEKQR
ncbi:hypothetical protein [Endozoicomonas atrinae]